MPQLLAKMNVWKFKMIFPTIPLQQNIEITYYLKPCIYIYTYMHACIHIYTHTHFLTFVVIYAFFVCIFLFFIRISGKKIYWKISVHMQFKHMYMYLTYVYINYLIIPLVISFTWLSVNDSVCTAKKIIYIHIFAFQRVSSFCTSSHYVLLL